MTRLPSTRRTVLGTVAGTLTALAGCTDSVQSGSSGSPFEDVTVDKAAVVVTLAADNEVERVNLIDPDGNRAGSSKVVSGETRLQFDLGPTYTPGTFKVVAEPAGETTIDIRPKLSIQDVGIGANHMDRMPDGLGSMKDVEAYVVLRNSGNGPAVVQDLIFSGDVPNPTDNLRESETRSGIFDTEDSKGEASSIKLFGGVKQTLFSTTAPFSFEGDGRDCEPTAYSEDFSVSLVSTVGEEVESRFSIRYEASESYDGCSATIQGSSE